jgi:hypothetical protein
MDGSGGFRRVCEAVAGDSTAISVMLFLAGVAELNLMSTLIRAARPARRTVD